MKKTTQFHIRPARPEEAGLFYTPHPEEDKRLGTVGHVRMDFGRSDNEFWHTWWPRDPEELRRTIRQFRSRIKKIAFAERGLSRTLPDYGDTGQLSLPLEGGDTS